ncbi:unnamed protein product [Symbiodinium natans]|uniref:Pentatricopeptide repeat-containing protein, chloroplastic n=1 Tax=Symbiodinium natans TaxID=878477 RepID=A0A812MB16_9DINO|nr:unnamed protein product [Symbiodinium natans]
MVTGLLRMSSQQVLPNAVTCSSALCGCQGRWLLALDLLEASERWGISLDIVSYGSAMGACSEAWEQALSLQQSLREMQLPSNIISYSALLESYGEWSEWSQGLSTLHTLKLTATLPDMVAMTSAMHACEGHGRWRHALQLSCGLAQAGIERDLQSCAAACAGIPSWAKALLVLQQVADLEEADPALLLNELRACQKFGQWSVALGLWASGKSPTGTLPANLVISACESTGEWEMALAFLACMLDQALDVDVVTCTSIISACEVNGHWKEVLRILDLMPRLRVSANQITWNSAISAAEKGSRWEMAMELLGHMAHERVADCISCSSTISACQKGRVWPRALEVLLSMPSQSLKPDSICWSSTLLAVAQGAAWAAALELLDFMRQARTHDLVSVCSGAEACHQAHEHLHVARLLAPTAQMCCRQLFDSRPRGL